MGGRVFGYKHTGWMGGASALMSDSTCQCVWGRAYDALSQTHEAGDAPSLVVCMMQQHLAEGGGGDKLSSS